jgi:succinate-semialdehyde dehydrogenase/glutarate-semialdehyde dehydrogenase
MGGNDANIILEDADLDANMDGIIFCRTLNNGQVCCANKRFIIQRSRQAEFVEKLVAGLKDMKAGDPMDPNSYMTCLASEKAAITVENQIKKQSSRALKWHWPVNGSVLLFLPRCCGM